MPLSACWALALQSFEDSQFIDIPGGQFCFGVGNALLLVFGSREDSPNLFYITVHRVDSSHHAHQSIDQTESAQILSRIFALIPDQIRTNHVPSQLPWRAVKVE